MADLVANTRLIGREPETRALTELLDGIHGRGAAIIIRGEAGIGKSSLLAEATAAARAHEFQVLSVAGVECETQLPFAGLHQFLSPIMAGVVHLPAPQRRAVEAAFGIADAPVPQFFLIALATLHLLSDAAAQAPILLVVEDAQWLDRPTAEVLRFLSRRVESDPIIILLAVRDGFESPLDAAGLPELSIERLNKEASAELLDARNPSLQPSVRSRVLEEAEGNPLALIELPALLETDLIASGISPARLPLTARLEAAFSARAYHLPDATCKALLAAAADDRGLLRDVLSATSILTLTKQDDAVMLPAIEAGLVKLELHYVRFSHPLMRSAIYQAATLPDRSATHRALAKVATDDPDRIAWHLAASATGPDEEIAVELEAAADRAMRRGATATAMDALRCAAVASPTSTAKAKRLLQAVELGFDVGGQHLLKDLVAEAETLEMDEPERLRLILNRTRFDDGAGAGPDFTMQMVRIADQAAESDIRLALGFLRQATLGAWWSNVDDESRQAIVAAVDKLQLPPAHPAVLVIKAVADPVRQAEMVINQLSQFAPDESVDPSLIRLYGQAATAVGDVVRGATLMEAAAAGFRRLGHLGLLAPALAFVAWAHIRLGAFTTAASAADEALRLSRETDQPRWVNSALAAKSMIAAVRGDTDPAERLALEAESMALPWGIRGITALLPLARGVLAMSAGSYEEAYRTLRRPFDPSDPCFHSQERWRTLGYLAEAAAYSDSYQDARRVVNELEPIAAMTPAIGIHVPMNYARAVLAEPNDAEPPFNAALAADLSRWPLERARLLLAYGQWLRRQRRVAESRSPLRTARDTFDALGALHWAEQARGELSAAGETSRKRARGAWDQLSPQELQIAQMAAEGLSNREIGERLYLSHRTVGSHLYRIFPKLGITSRSQLHQALAHSAA